MPSSDRPGDAVGLEEGPDDVLDLEGQLGRLVVGEPGSLPLPEVSPAAAGVVETVGVHKSIHGSILRRSERAHIDGDVGNRTANRDGGPITAHSDGGES